MSMSEMTPEQIAARIEEIDKRLEELEKEKDEPAELDKRLHRVEIANEQLKSSLEDLKHATDRLARVAETA